MTKHRVLLWILAAVMAISGAPGAQAAPAPKPKAPAVGQKAGAISALLPVATVTRGVGRAAAKSEVKKGEELYWNDLLQTAKGGRARITLNDQSILSLGSQAELRIVKHDARTQQTLLQMTYGRVRAEVSAITRDGGRFEVRTPTAVAGVIGTDFGTDSSVGGTTFICISGAVSVSNSDPGVPGSVQCNAGQTTTVNTGKAPTPPKPATPEQIQQLIMDTTPATINALSPAAALPGLGIDATVTGSKLGGVNSVQITGSGVTASLNPGGSDTSLAVHLVVAANAQPGLRTITLNKASGAGSATFFTVLTPPSQAQNTSGDPKKPYHDALDQLRQTGDSSLDTILAAIQQLVDQTEQALSGQNQNLTPQVDLTQATGDLNSQVAAVQNAVHQGKTAIDQAATGAGSGFDSAYTTAYNALLQRNAAGTPDDTFNQALGAAFQQASAALQQEILSQQNTVSSLVQSSGNSIGQISQGWMNTITSAMQSQGGGPTPNVRSTEITADLGATVTLDANSSRASSGASVIGYSWALCDASYRPSQFGVALNGNPQGCSPLAGMQSTSPEFTFATCNLQANDYIARLVVTDSNQKQSAMDVKVHVLAPTYPDAAATEMALAQAYSSLQLSQYMGFFDDVNFPGYTTLSENVRRTFPSLASMNINVIVSSATTDCNTATVRANWEQNYAFTGSPNFINQQSEQLQHTMLRTPGKGWKIVDQHGDNGTVSGSGTSLPGPTTTDAALPDLQVTALAIPSGVNANNALNVASGSANFVATITNVGAADLTAVTPVHFAIRQSSDGSGPDIASTDQNIPIPLAVNASVQMPVSMVVPNLQPGTPLSFVVIANPGGATPEKDLVTKQSDFLSFLVGVPLPDLRVTGINPSAGVAGAGGVLVVIPGPITFTVPVQNAGNLALTAPTTVHFSLRDASNTEVAFSDQNIPVPLNASSSVNVSATLTMPAAAAGARYSLIATANPGCTVQEIFCDTANAGAINLAIGATSILQASTVSLVSGATTPQVLQVSVNGPANLTLVLPTGIHLASGSLNQSTTGAGTLSWNLTADFTPALGANLTTQLLDATNLLPPVSIVYSVTGQANYRILASSILFNGNPGPFTGTNAMQVGSTNTVSAVVENTGNLTQSGSITVSFNCSGPNAGTHCNTPNVVTVAAPPANGNVTASANLGTNNLPPGAYTGTATLSTALAQSDTTDDSASISFDSFDFTLAAQNGSASPINLFLGGSFSLSALLTQTGSATFPMAIVQTSPAPGVTVSGPATLTSGAAQNYPVNAAFTAAPGAANISLAATNRGVTKTLSQAFNLVAPFVQTAAPAMTSGSRSQALSLQVNTAGSLTLGALPIGISIDPQAACAGGALTTSSGSTTGAQTLTWCLLAATNSATGALTVPVSMTATNPADFTGTYTVPANMTVAGLPNYTVQTNGITFAGHTGALTGSDALQSGETTTASIVVLNNGNASPGGSITVTFDCPNCGTPQTATVAAPAFGSTVTATIPYPSVAFPVGTNAGTATLTTVIPESNPNDNTQTLNFETTDFTLSFNNSSVNPIQLFLGGSFTLDAVLQETGPTPFNMNVTGTSSGPGQITAATPASLAPSTPTAPTAIAISASSNFTTGTTTYTLSATNHGVTKSVTQVFAVTAPFIQTAAPVLTQGGGSNALTVQANIDGTFVLGPLPTGVTTGDPLSVQVFSPGQIVTWNLTAGSGSPTGALTLPLAISGSSGFTGTFNGLVSYTIGAAPDYAVTAADFSFVGHTSPYTGAQAVQVGENFNINVTVHNVGTASPVGTITVNISCTPPGSVSTTTNCQGNPTPVTVAAPTAGNSVVATFTGLQFQDPAGAAPGYTGNVSISAVDINNNPIAEISTANNAASDTFDITDFALSLPAAGSQPAGGFTPFQNILYPSGAAQMTIAVNQVGLATGAYGVALAGGGLPNTTVAAPASLTTGGAFGTVNVTVNSNTPTGATNNVVVTGTNRGVSHSLLIPVNVVQAQIGLSDPVLKLNDLNDPLSLQIGASATTITLQLSGTPFAGSAALTPAVVSGINASTVTPSSVGSGQTFDWSLAALTGAPTVSTAQNITAAIPDTNPPDAVTFPLFVKAAGVPDLQVTGYTPTIGPSTPWLSGEAKNFTVSVQNNQGSTSAGGEDITGTLNGNQDLRCTLPTAVPPIAAGNSANVTVHCIAPDFHDQTFSNASASMQFKIASDPGGDLNYANNTYSNTIAVANWHAAVGSCTNAPNCGATDLTALPLAIFSSGTGYSNTTTVGSSIDGGGSSTATFGVSNGAVSTGLLLTAPSSTSPGGNFSVTIGNTIGTIQDGIYLAQVVMELTDPLSGQVTATRQATVHIAVSNAGAGPGTITFTSSANNTTSGSPVQINGALSEILTVTGNCSGCTSGTYDLTVHDDPLTSTDVNSVPGSQLASNVTIGAPQTLTVSAQQDASGNIATGLTSTYTVSATAPQLAKARGIAPDTAGISQPLYFQVGDFDIVAAGVNGNSCGNVVPNGTPLSLSVSFSGSSGFNASGSYKWLDSGGSPVGGTPVSFGGDPVSGTLPFSGNSTTPYSALNFTLSNTQALDGLQTYLLAVTITNATTSATKFFPFYFDASTAQNYCGIVSGARGMTRIRGSWNRSALGGGSILSAARTLKQPATGAKGTPDVRVNAQDITYSPSVPKAGDTVEVRFRISNQGDGDARGVPIALQVNGRTVASDTFDVAAGHSTLAGLQWSNAEAPPARAIGFRSGRPGPRRESEAGDFSGDAPTRAVALMLVVDPQHTMQQKSTLQKYASVARFSLAPGGGSALGAPLAASAANTQRLILEMNDGACVGIHLATGGTTSCGSADLEISVQDLAKGAYSFSALNGISDLGQSFGGTAPAISGAQLSSARYSSQALGQVGHSYAVQLSGGRTAIVTVRSIRSPGQLDARTRQIFRQNARRVLRGLGGDTEAPSAPGDVSGAAPQATVYFELLVQGP